MTPSNSSFCINLLIDFFVSYKQYFPNDCKNTSLNFEYLIKDGA